MPAIIRLQHAAYDGRQDRPKSQHDAHQREHARRGLALMEVADHRPGQDGCRDRPEGLEEARADQLIYRLRQKASHRGADIENEPADQDRAPPEAVRERSEEELADRAAEEGEAQGQLDRGHVDAEMRADSRPRGTIGVGRERADRGQRAKQHDQQAAVAGEHGWGYLNAASTGWRASGGGSQAIEAALDIGRDRRAGRQNGQ